MNILPDLNSHVIASDSPQTPLLRLAGRPRCLEGAKYMGGKDGSDIVGEATFAY